MLEPTVKSHYFCKYKTSEILPAEILWLKLILKWPTFLLHSPLLLWILGWKTCRTLFSAVRTTDMTSSHRMTVPWFVWRRKQASGKDWAWPSLTLAKPQVEVQSQQSRMGFGADASPYTCCHQGDSGHTGSRTSYHCLSPSLSQACGYCQKAWQNKPHLDPLS